MTYNPNFSGAGNVVSSKSNTGDFVNNTGITLVKGTPVRITATGLSTINVSQEVDIDGITGVVVNNIPDTVIGTVMTSGRLENIVTTASVGSVLYLSTTGALTDIKPQSGVNGFVDGDFAISIGTVTTNLVTPTNKDLLVRIQLLGQL